MSDPVTTPPPPKPRPRAVTLTTRARAELLLRQRHPERANATPWVREGGETDLDDVPLAV